MWAIPGVLRIGFGFKETAGDVLDEPALRVYVAAKRPADELSPEELIPPEVHGIPTDVLVFQESRPECKVRIHAGGRITREIPNDRDQIGTLGCIVHRPDGLHILSNEHVLVAVSSTKDVWSPSPGTSGDRVAVEVSTPAPIPKQDKQVGQNTYVLDCENCDWNESEEGDPGIVNFDRSGDEREPNRYGPPANHRQRFQRAVNNSYSVLVVELK